MTRTIRTWALVVTTGFATVVRGQDIQVNPNRPTFATPALTTQVGVAELEFGLAHSLVDDGHLSSTPFLLKFGLLKRLELRIGGNGLVHSVADGDGAHSATGYGDTTLGAQWTFWPHGPLGIDEAVQVTWKIPTASSSNGLGSGHSDVFGMILFSRDFGPFHADLNFLDTSIGTDTPHKRESQPAEALSVSRTVNDHWSVTGELYSLGKTSQNDLIVSNLWALGYKVSPRLVLDSGVDVGLTHAAPKITFFAGLTTGLGRFHRVARP